MNEQEDGTDEEESGDMSADDALNIYSSTIRKIEQSESPDSRWFNQLYEIAEQFYSGLSVADRYQLIKLMYKKNLDLECHKIIGYIISLFRIDGEEETVLQFMEAKLQNVIDERKRGLLYYHLETVKNHMLNWDREMALDLMRKNAKFLKKLRLLCFDRDAALRDFVFSVKLAVDHACGHEELMEQLLLRYCVTDLRHVTGGLDVRDIRWLLNRDIFIPSVRVWPVNDRRSRIPIFNGLFAGSAEEFKMHSSNQLFFYQFLRRVVDLPQHAPQQQYDRHGMYVLTLDFVTRHLKQDYLRINLMQEHGLIVEQLPNIYNHLDMRHDHLRFDQMVNSLYSLFV